jgi:signal transduction histidine kinase
VWYRQFYLQDFPPDHSAPVFWESWWFRVATIIAVAALVYVLSKKARARKVQEIEKLRLRIASDLHDEIGSSLGSIALMADHLSERFTPDESGFRRLQEMSINARQMSDAIRDIIWFVDTQRNSVEDLTDRLRSIARTMLPRTMDTSFSTQTNHPSDVLLAMEQKRNLILMFKEIMHNIVRHARPSKVEIVLRHMSERLEIQVNDNGRGFNQEQVTKGNGLVNLHRRANDLGGECSIRSTVGQGTAITLSIPLSSSASRRGSFRKYHE